MPNRIVISSKGLNIKDIIEVARNNALVELDNSLKQKITASQELVKKVVDEEKIVYGITTGFGSFKNQVISKEDTKKLQRNIILSHACGVGQPFPEEIVRALMLVRINSLSFGYSGIRLETLETLIQMLNKKVHPIIPEQGSVGASGDLCQLSHMALVLIGEGEAIFEGKKMPGKEAMQKAGIKIIELDAKEGLALNNGTSAMTAIAALAVFDAENLALNAWISSALSLEALQGRNKAFDEKIHKLRPFKGQIDTAKILMRLTQDSEIIAQSKSVQNAYSLRCIPQVHGASIDAINYVKKIVEIEINSVTDNPLIFIESEEIISGGNFHGQPIALAMDFLGIALSELANIAERRVARLIDSNLSNGLPPYLIQDGGLNSGFMIPQYTAASLVSENKVLAHPASVDSIPTSANEEDHVSMGTTAARKCRAILKNSCIVIGIEMCCAAQGLEFRKPLKSGKGTLAAFEKIREHVPKVESDEEFYKIKGKVLKLMKSNEILKAVEQAIGKLSI